MKKGSKLHLEVKRWNNKINGNTYHRVKVYVNGKLIGESKMTYGYGSQYLITAKNILEDKGQLKGKPLLQGFRSYLRDNDIKLEETVKEVTTQKALKSW